jgi:hypothetical protein
MKKQVIECLIAAAALLASCAPVAQPTPQAAANFIRIEHWVTGIGSANADNTQQTLTYQLTLVNASSTAVDVHSIDLILNDAIGQRAATPDRRVAIERTLLPRATYQVDGELTFDATGVSKSQIAAWGPPITRITVAADYPAASSKAK